MNAKRYFAVAALLLAGALQAQNLNMDTAEAGASSDRPTRGMSEARVESRFGPPARKVAAVGEPPISRWEYPGFVVYFEYDKVIHSVTRR